MMIDVKCGHPGHTYIACDFGFNFSIPEMAHCSNLTSGMNAKMYDDSQYLFTFFLFYEQCLPFCFTPMIVYMNSFSFKLFF